MATFSYPVKIKGKVIPAHTHIDEADIAGAAKETENVTESLDKLTVAQLKALAAEKGVDVSACKVKAEYIDAINGA